MKFAKLLHNPGAGDGDHSSYDLAKMIYDAGFQCSASSVKKVDNENINIDKYDFVVLAGGDGTVRKAVKKLLKENLPIGLLPMGTANNIAKTLGISGAEEQIVASWNKDQIKSFDVGRIYGLNKKYNFFLEGFGYGVFPSL
jgi:diacylglycerol kinase (ATP)